MWPPVRQFESWERVPWEEHELLPRPRPRPRPGERGHPPVRRGVLVIAATLIVGVGSGIYGLTTAASVRSI